VRQRNIKPIYRDAIRAALLGLFVNFALGLAKLAGGIAGNSFALIADAVNSIGDVVATVVVLFALRVAQRPPDNEHPYGHSRAEGIAASNVAMLIVISAVMIAWEAMHRFHETHTVPPLWTLWIAGLNVLIKEALYHYKVRVGRRTGSIALIVNAWDHRSDAFCSLAVFVGLVTIIVGGEKFVWADEAASLFVAIAIAFSGMKLFLSSREQLMDAQAEPQFVADVTRIAASTENVTLGEKIWIRKSGLEYFVDIHIEVPPQLSVSQGHDIAHQVKEKLFEEYPTIRDVMVHVEPDRQHAREIKN
jgi:cation diffusion facilitator family transporter